MKQRGFTLIEMMVTVVIVAIIAAIAVPSYQEYVRRQRLAVAQQAMQTLAGELERHRAKNFSYKGFDAVHIYPDYNKATGQLKTPIDKDAKTYTITLVDASTELPINDTTATQSWAMVAVREPADPRNYDALLRSDGTRCKTKMQVNNYTDCGSNSEAW